MDSRAFRERVLDQRDKITEQFSAASGPALSADGDEQLRLLGEIHGTLKSIERKLEAR